jgi:hypothetical protein
MQRWGQRRGPHQQGRHQVVHQLHQHASLEVPPCRAHPGLGQLISTLNGTKEGQFKHALARARTRARSHTHTHTRTHYMAGSEWCACLPWAALCYLWGPLGKSSEALGVRADPASPDQRTPPLWSAREHSAPLPSKGDCWALLLRRETQNHSIHLGVLQMLGSQGPVGGGASPANSRGD